MGGYLFISRKIKSIIGSKKGLTLVELSVVLTLLALVLTVILSYQFFGIQTLNRAQNKSNAQHDLLVVSEFITNELRIASKIELAPSMPSYDNEGLYYIGLNPDTNQPIFRSSKESRLIIDSDIDHMIFTFSEDSDLLEFSISSTAGGDKYQIESGVALPNITDFSPEGNLSGSCICYEKP